MNITLKQPLVIHEVGKRANQEDSLRPSNPTDRTRCFVLCDGMGGHEKGEVASNAVTKVMEQQLSDLRDGDVLTVERFNDVLAAAYDELDRLDDPDAVKKMGTTLTFVAFHAGGVMAAHIGDSRIYHFRPATQQLIYRSRDHSLVQDLYELGEITAEEMLTSPQRHVITRCLQPHQQRRARADIHQFVDVQPGDWFYMCSDGMLENITDEELTALFCDTSLTPDEKRSRLIDNSAGNRDNHTAFLIEVDSVDGVDGEPELLVEVESVPSDADEDSSASESWLKRLLTRLKW